VIQLHRLGTAEVDQISLLSVPLEILITIAPVMFAAANRLSLPKLWTSPSSHTPLKTSTATFTFTPTDLFSVKKTAQKPTVHNTMLNAADFTLNDFHSEVETQTKLVVPM